MTNDTTTITKKLEKVLLDFNEAVNKDANRKPDASPWSLVHLSGMRKILQSYNIVRELLIHERAKKVITKDMTVEQKHKIVGETIDQVETDLHQIIGEEI